MKRILIVDDEHFVRLGFKTAIELDNDQYTVIGEAENGKEASEMILSLWPDLVFLDITMPGGSGLEVLADVREKGYDGYISMLTSHESFSFAQSAVKHEANDYVLKSELSGKNIQDYLGQIVWPESDAHKEKIKQQFQERQLQEEKRQQFLLNILRIGFDQKDTLQAKKRYHYAFHEDDFYLLGFQIQNFPAVMQRYATNAKKVLSNTIVDLLEESLYGTEEYEILQYRKDLFVLLISFAEESSQQKKEQKIYQICTIFEQNTKSFLELDLLMAASHSQMGLSTVHHLFDTTQKLLGQAYFYPETKLYWNIGDTYTEDGFSELLEELKRQLADLLEGNVSLSSRQIVSKFLETCKQQKVLVNQWELEFVLFDFVCQHAEALDRSPPLHDEKLTFAEILSQLEQVDSERNELQCTDNHLVSQAIVYISNHFADPIRLTDLADALHVSSGHLSRSFSAETGIPFQEYLTERRIEHAKKLIKTTNLKQYEIAERCGFQSAVHFSNMFKKEVGLTPSQYRSSQLTI